MEVEAPVEAAATAVVADMEERAEAWFGKAPTAEVEELEVP